jgi:hypothetical protein
MNKFLMVAVSVWMFVATIALGVVTGLHALDCSIHGDWFALSMWSVIGSIAFSLMFAATIAMICRLAKLQGT